MATSLSMALMWLYLLTISSLSSASTSRQLKCVPIQASLCAKIGYNSTRFPNFAGSDSERSALDEFQSFEPLIGIRCSDELRFFLCASYFPLCNEKVPDPIGPCRPLCKRVRTQCLSVLKEFDYPWPPNLECSKFPEENNEESMCMEGPSVQESTSQTHDAPLSPNHQQVPMRKHESSVMQPDLSGSYPTCRSNEHVYMNRTALCVPKCSHTHGYQPTDLHSTRSALIIGSILSFTLTTVCLVSSCLGRRMLKERRPIDNTMFYSAFCFAFSALVYMLSVFQRDKIACFSYQVHELFVVPGIPHVPCTLVASLLYYSGTSARLWWLCTCAAWRWSIRSNNKKAANFLYNAHVFAWATPFVLLTIALMAQAAHAEQLSGICLIGAVGRGNFRMFILLRDLAVIVASILILASGCLTSAHSLSSSPSATNNFMASNGIGILCAILPIAQSFWFLAAVQQLYSSVQDPVVGVGRMAKLLADPSLGALLGGSFFVYILHSCWGDPSTCSSSSSMAIKNGYHAGRPLYPTPIALHHPNGGNLTSTTSVPITSSSQRSSANIQSATNVYPNGPPSHPPPLPPLSTLRQIGNC